MIASSGIALDGPYQVHLGWLVGDSEPNDPVAIDWQPIVAST